MAGFPWKPITTEAALGVNTGAASNVSSSRYVRLFNTAAVLNNRT